MKTHNLTDWCRATIAPNTVTAPQEAIDKEEELNRSGESPYVLDGEDCWVLWTGFPEDLGVSWFKKITEELFIKKESA